MKAQNSSYPSDSAFQIQKSEPRRELCIWERLLKGGQRGYYRRHRRREKALDGC